jgi:dihydroorotase
VLPPLRIAKDRKSLHQGLKNGDIGVICSGHLPQDMEAKKVEFAQAVYGMSNLELCFALACTHLSGTLPLDKLIEKLAHNPRRLLVLPVPVVKEGAPANLTLFDPKTKWTVDGGKIASRSKNTPLIGQKLTGQVLGVINGKQSKIFQS